MAKNPIKWGLGVLLLALSLGLALVAYRALDFWMSTPVPQNNTPKWVFYDVHKQATPITIARDLEKLGVITHARHFYWYSRVTGKSSKIKSADYRFSNQMRPDEVLAILTSGISYGWPLTIPEGYNMYQVADLFEKLRPGSRSAFLKACTDLDFIGSLGFSAPLPQSLEGYLFPDTYSVTRRTDEREVITNMVEKYREVFTSEYEARAKELGFTPHQIMTLASIIEKETGAEKERPMIASVFHNRLKKKIRLQSDPTVVYGLKDYDGNITRAHLQAKTPYNTYVIPALPIGPISNPGKDAIKAALYPAESNYLFFVSHNDGTHEFTETYKDHQKAVEKFQLDPKAREGHSWRELKKKP